MTETQFLALAFACLAFANWAVAVTLGQLAYREPRIRALTERAVLATVIAILTTAYAVVVANSDNHLLMSFETARDLVRIVVFALGLYPLWWLWAYYRGKF